MTDIEYESLIADTGIRHAEMLRYALSLIKPLLPFTAEKIEHQNKSDIPNIEFLIFRFSKFQDLIGDKILKVILEKKGEQIARKTQIDILNMAEKFYFIPDKQQWLAMRELRNNLTHEYPHKPNETAEFLNKAVTASYEMLEIWENLKKIMEEA